ncbi:SDR family NAD(P)-dependent oxidoreductase [Jiangella rhizosphaerae]|uniref:SDR family NAD(P)-dependent oxidoreductase n=1 Tax=Jiangella rhizosphaerae TaxID=2293569 RepID=A0A418KHQ6_9ACTN|nr:SDR family NAD(P)-dependent oxidoreductase [Jiangella rhizosphaerae]RIQ11784.1 SDR family NAD(P)-dependent oxidoreductase [Jiangella rhizosphaerae]
MAESKGAVLVTGANGGIGAAAVRALAGRGTTVFATVRGDASAIAGVKGVRVVEMDVTDPASVTLAAKKVSHDVGGAGLRAVVNNAGVIVQGPLELVPQNELRRQFEVNTFGPAYVTQSFLPLLRAGGGRVVNVSAPTAWVPVPFLGPIGASKAALESLSGALRGELAVWKIPVVLVEPGTTSTLIFAKAEAAARGALNDADPGRVALYRQHLAAVEKAAANQRTSPPEKVAAAIVKAVEARRPRRWYAASSDVRVLRLVSRLRAGLRDAMIARTFGLSGIKAAA